MTLRHCFTNLVHGLLFLATVASCATAYAGQPTWLALPPPPPLPQPVESGYAAVNGIRMYYAIFGSGTPILLIHNGLGSADDWGGVVPALATRHTVIVADTRGFGRSTRDATPYSYHLLADDYVALLDSLHIERAVVVGTSDGAIIGLEIAVYRPDKLAGLFIQGANIDEEGLQQPPLFLEAIRLALARSRSEYARLSPTPADFDQFRTALTTLENDNPILSAAQLASIQVQTVVAISDHEESIKRSHSERIAAAIPNARTIELEGVSHFAPLQRPGAFAAAVDEFAKQIKP